MENGNEGSLHPGYTRSPDLPTQQCSCQRGSSREEHLDLETHLL